MTAHCTHPVVACKRCKASVTTADIIRPVEEALGKLERAYTESNANMVRALRTVERMVLEKAEPGLIANQIQAIIRTVQG